MNKIFSAVCNTNLPYLRHWPVLGSLSDCPNYPSSLSRTAIEFYRIIPMIRALRWKFHNFWTLDSKYLLKFEFSFFQPGTPVKETEFKLYRRFFLLSWIIIETAFSPRLTLLLSQPHRTRYYTIYMPMKNLHIFTSTFYDYWAIIFTLS